MLPLVSSLFRWRILPLPYHFIFAYNSCIILVNLTLTPVSYSFLHSHKVSTSIQVSSQKNDCLLPRWTRLTIATRFEQTRTGTEIDDKIKKERDDRSNGTISGRGIKVWDERGDFMVSAVHGRFPRDLGGWKGNREEHSTRTAASVSCH